jgi:murein DD-endopeptidase MepM/ murein hydrolase activator NlpD
MAAENVHERKEKRHFTVVLISGTDSKHTRTFSASLWKLIGVVVSVFVVLSALITATIVYTPVGSRLPISNPKLETEYGKQIQEIRERMGLLFEQLNDLRGYNVRLRKALGEEISAADSGLIAAGYPDNAASAGANGPTGPADGAAARSREAADGETAGQAEPGTVFMVSEVAADGRAMIPLTLPTQGFVTREFMPGEYHYGMDFAAKEGNPVLAAAPGYVIFAGWTTGDGNMMMISHAGGFVTVYKHNKSLLKSVGDAVRRGELVAQVGNTGRSTAPHLHFEVWRDGVAQNAANYLLTTQ